MTTIIETVGTSNKNDDNCMLDGPVYLDDEAFLFDNSNNSGDIARTTFPKDSNSKFISGPQKPDVSNMGESEAAAVLKAYKDKERLH